MSDTHPNPLTESEIRALLEKSSARLRFYHLADERWLDWLWKNGFFDVLRKSSAETTEDGRRLPETGYLFRMAKIAPEKVVEIMLDITIAEKTLNRDVVEKFLWICNILPAELLARVVPKIKDERWFGLLHSASCRDFPQMAMSLFDSGRHQSLITLAEAMLAVRSDESEGKFPYWRQAPFHVSDFSHCKLFHYLANVEETQLSRAFALVAGALAKVARMRCRRSRQGAFELDDNMFLASMNFFSREPNRTGDASRTDDSRDLATAAKALATRLAGARNGTQGPAPGIFARQISSLPDCQSMWRFKLLLMSLSPAAFKHEMRNAIFRLFEGNRGHEVACGVEYSVAAGSAFPTLSSADQENFTRGLLDNAKKSPVFANIASNVLSSICDLVTEDVLRAAKKLGLSVDPNQIARPETGTENTGEARIPPLPVGHNELTKFPVEQIAVQLRTGWAPQALARLKDDMPISPTPNDVAVAIREDIRTRPREYTRNASMFFSRDDLDPHYTHVFIDAIRRLARDSRDGLSSNDIDEIIDCCLAVTRADKERPLARPDPDPVGGFVFLIGWEGVRFDIAYLMCVLLHTRSGRRALDFKAHRDKLLSIVAHLVTSSAPVSGRDVPATNRSLPKPLAANPYGAAINSTSGTAFEALVLFTHRDCMHSTESRGATIADDIRAIYEDALHKCASENLRFDLRPDSKDPRMAETRREPERQTAAPGDANTGDPTIISMFGRHFCDLYNLDSRWATHLLPRVFPTNSDGKGLFLVSWLGFLQCDPAIGLVDVPGVRELYRHGLAETNETNLKANFLGDAEHRLSGHYARFFARIPEFDIGHPMFDEFINSPNTRLLAEFVRHVGEWEFMDASTAPAPLARKLERFWERSIRPNAKQGMLVEFGYWINASCQTIPPERLAHLARETLELTGGELLWPGGIEKAAPTLAEHAPEDTLEIIRLRLNVLFDRNEAYSIDFKPERPWHRALWILLNNPRTARETHEMLEHLIPRGEMFLPLQNLLPHQLMAAK